MPTIISLAPLYDGSVNNAKIAAQAVTKDKIQMATAKILGRTTAGTGAAEEIAIGTGLTMAAGTLSASISAKQICSFSMKSLSIGGGPSTMYITLFGLRDTQAQTGDLAAEDNAKMVMPIAATFKNLFVTVGTHTGASNSTCTIRNNGADGALTVTITASTTGDFSDTTHSQAIAQGADANWKLDWGSNGGSLVVLSISAEIDL